MRPKLSPSNPYAEPLMKPSTTYWMKPVTDARMSIRSSAPRLSDGLVVGGLDVVRRQRLDVLHVAGAQRLEGEHRDRLGRVRLGVDDDLAQRRPAAAVDVREGRVLLERLDVLVAVLD